MGAWSTFADLATGTCVLQCVTPCWPTSGRASGPTPPTRACRTRTFTTCPAPRITSRYPTRKHPTHPPTPSILSLRPSHAQWVRAQWGGTEWPVGTQAPLGGGRQDSDQRRTTGLRPGGGRPASDRLHPPSMPSLRPGPLWLLHTRHLMIKPLLVKRPLGLIRRRMKGSRWSCVPPPPSTERISHRHRHHPPSPPPLGTHPKTKRLSLLSPSNQSPTGNLLCPSLPLGD